jgi:hypothetical protein
MALIKLVTIITGTVLHNDYDNKDYVVIENFTKYDKNFCALRVIEQAEYLKLCELNYIDERDLRTSKIIYESDLENNYKILDITHSFDVHKLYKDDVYRPEYFGIEELFEGEWDL